MKTSGIVILSTLCVALAMQSEPLSAASNQSERQSYKIYVDKNGVMRRSDTKEEVAYYGTNYTLPFAHAYRAVGNLGLDRKEAIDKDIYHMKRLGFNGFRLHLWDVELSDSAGNLLANDHLDLLDYMIAQLEKEGIDIVLTAQTNFGNGYPEKNIDTGAFSYDFGKCEIHSDKEAQEIQANYLTQLASHLNPYTGRSYADDNAIIAIEINNEPCHTDTPKEVTAYINKMVKALKKGGFDKPILYNVSHNPDVTEAYYNADIQGTTYQWYPTGLVSGHQRKGNFLPYVDQYPIPWKETMKNYDKMARVVYEFDPGDVLYSYLYPAIARTFRKEGFQWITQFAYDPIDIAKYNTEYQTHFLNLAYTPGKALSMMIAGEATREIPRNSDFGTFPADTVFGDFTVSYADDLSVYNSGSKFYHSNSTTIHPKDINSLTNIAGVGSSPIVSYDGTGAYFLDEVKPGLWRLEIMPDVAIVEDPFEKPSPNKEIAKIFYKENPLSVSLPQLGEKFYYQAINSGNHREGEAKESVIPAYPGVYLLSGDKNLISEEINSPAFKNGNLSAYVAPKASDFNNVVIFQPAKYINPGEDLVIEAQILGNELPQEVNIYPDYVSFWKEDNTIIPMKNISGNTYRAVIPKEDLGWKKDFNFNIVVKEDSGSYTWPGNIPGNPLDWDFSSNEYYSSHKITPESPIVLLKPEGKDSQLEVTMIPEAWDFRVTPDLTAPVGEDSYEITSLPKNEGKLIIRRYVGDELAGAPFLNDKEYVVVKAFPMAEWVGSIVSLTSKNGATYSAVLNRQMVEELPVKLHSDNPHGVEFRVPLSDFIQTETNIVPAVYPSFLPREINLGEIPFNSSEIEFVDLVIPTNPGHEISSSLQGIWLE